MVNRVVLNNVIHRDVRIAATRPTRENAALNLVSVIPREFTSLLAHYPIFFTKNTETGRFDTAALLGFLPQENLFFVDGRWGCCLRATAGNAAANRSLLVSPVARRFLMKIRRLWTWRLI